MKLMSILKEERKKHHLTQAQLSQELHVSRKTISDWENGRSMPSVYVLINLSNIYGTPINLFLKNKRYSKKITISYYLNIILLLLSYFDLFGIITRIIPIFLFINLCFLIKEINNYNKNILDYRRVIKVGIISILFTLMSTTVAVIIRDMTYIFNIDSAYQAGLLTGFILVVLFRLISFFYFLMLSRYLL